MTKTKISGKFIDEAEDELVDEMNYTCERKNLDGIHKIIKKRYDEFLVVPESYPEYCTPDVMIMEFLEGERLIDASDRWFGEMAANMGMSKQECKKKVEDQWKEEAEKHQKDQGEANLSPIEFMLQSWKYHLAVKLSGIDMEQLDVPRLVGPLVEAHGFELIVKGIFNGDPHAGNVLLLKDGRIGLIDYGCTRQVEKAQRVKYAKVVVALIEDDGSEAAQKRVANAGSQLLTLQKPDDWAMYLRIKAAFGARRKRVASTIGTLISSRSTH
eukprot:gnl/MRDRNA2_/MRDRNA2_75056_c0_seq1.p1 gnl/MRDRNA2_/MRDRNA2_75056_c0~~gnl/MRDRNA2_/MRDRNA2_75056_c0_seq1.p1  ORF type:complete len:270 (-),score=73.52 gnl/MRDRNA2_/MRDRNA2_75056_c0_seq1:270-1079(-)